jgi:hypothetical protein
MSTPERPDAHLLDRSEIAAMFGVPEHLVGGGDPLECPECGQRTFGDAEAPPACAGYRSDGIERRHPPTLMVRRVQRVTTYRLGFALAHRWEPKRGEGDYHKRRRWPRRWSFSLRVGWVGFGR